MLRSSERGILKGLAILGGTALIVAVILVSGYYQNSDANNKSYNVKCVRDSQASSAASSFTCKIDSGKEAEQGEAKPPWWHLLLAWPEGITAWLLLLTLGAIVWQAWETRAAAQSAEKQIALQSVAMRQWVNVEPIKTVTPPTFTNPLEVTLQFQILNKTDYLLTVQRIEAEVFHRGKARIFKVSCNVPIPPEKSSADGGYPFYMTLFVDRGTWPGTGAFFFAGGEVTYLDCMDVERTQEFRDMFEGYEDGRLVRKRPSGQVPEIAEHKPKDDEPETGYSKYTWFSWAMRKLTRGAKRN